MDIDASLQMYQDGAHFEALEKGFSWNSLIPGTFRLDDSHLCSSVRALFLEADLLMICEFWTHSHSAIRMASLVSSSTSVAHHLKSKVGSPSSMPASVQVL